MRSKALASLAVLLALAPHLCAATAPTPSFTISATPITIASTGTSIPFTLTSVNGFAGTFGVTCTNPNPPVGVREPNCGDYGPVPPPIILTANATATGAMNITAAQPLPVHEASTLNLPRHRKAPRWALAGVLMLGLGLRRRSARATRLMLAVGTLIGLTGMSACGNGVETLTPGIYTYTLTANPSAQSNPPLSVSTTVNVTVPPGIIVQPTIGPGPI